MTKYSDSTCAWEEDLTLHEKSFLPRFNGMIVYGDCHPLDPFEDNPIKFKVDCVSSSSIRFRYYNYFGND